MPSPKTSNHGLFKRKVGGGRGGSIAVLVIVCICTSILCYAGLKGTLKQTIPKEHSLNVPQLIKILNAKVDNRTREEEVKKVVFIKLIKVAGTTVQYILHKYAERNSLKVAEVREPGEEEVQGTVCIIFYFY